MLLADLGWADSGFCSTSDRMTTQKDQAGLGEPRCEGVICKDNSFTFMLCPCGLPGSMST